MAHTDYPELGLMIDGEWITKTDAAIDVLNPADETVIGTLPVAGEAELDRALASAQGAFDVWKNVSAFKRYKILRRGAEILRERVGDIAVAMTLEQGKPLDQSKAELLIAADLLDWMAEEGRRVYGRLVPSVEPLARQMIRKDPIGVVAAFTPWNFPAASTMRKIGASLAVGCACIIKPSEETPATAIGIAKALQEAGLPDGVLNVVFGDPDAVSRHLIASPIVRKVSLTGSVAVGKHLARLSADGLKRVTLELGGHGPTMVFDDTDIERSLDELVPYKYRNAGQVCISTTRFYVQEGSHKAFVQGFKERVEKIRVGNGMDEGVDMGPLANDRRLAAMEELIGEAVRSGADLVHGGARVGNRGYFFEPTILDNVPETARIMNEEPFGPVALIAPFKTLNEVIERANRLEFGLAAYAYTNCSRRIERLSNEIEAGMLGVNMLGITSPEGPFGGIKESGYGSEGGVEALDAYTQTRKVMVNALP